ncbi:AAA family ATPase [Halobacteriales archaeon SW_5_70_135]|nr:MAG: AAA family ATPase [Halobacteriales archaeon SW_5_70_135]
MSSVDLRGVVLDVGDVESVSTAGGRRELAEVLVRPLAVDGEDPAEVTVEPDETPEADLSTDAVTVTLWGDWTETAERLSEGMELLVTAAEVGAFGGEVQFSTGRESRAVIEPGYLVDVTDVRSWVQCPRMYYLNKLTAIPLNYPVVKGTVVHEVFGDLLRGRDLERAVADRVEEVGLELGLLGRSAAAVRDDVRANADAVQGWLEQGRLTDADKWRSERTLIGERYGLKGRADAVRRGSPVELKTGKNTGREPRFHDKAQAACYALIMAERGVPPDTGTLLYTKNAALDRTEAAGDLSPAKEFSIGPGLLDFVLRARNGIAAAEFDGRVPTGYEADAVCEHCFEQDTCMVVSGRLDQESKAGRIGTVVPETERAYFERFYRLIEEERRETHREYAKLWEQSAAERVADDRALIDLAPAGRRRLPDGRWELRAERPPGDGDSPAAVSKLREGDVVLASDGHPVRGTAELARVERLSAAEVVVTVDEPLALRRVDVYPSELSADRMLTAVHDLVLKGDERRKDVLFGRREPAFEEPAETFVDDNDAQDAAVRRAVGAEDVALVRGPPGTGKTYTIARTVRALVERGERVLVAAFTNRAVDNCLDALREQGYDFAPEAGRVVRVGTETGVREDMQSVRLSSRGDPQEQAAQLREAPVVAATTAACGSRVMRETEFDAAIVDEAGQLTEPETLLATERADRFVLVGDDDQLPPVVRAENDLSTSLFERLRDEYPDAAVTLDRQYRMAQRVQAFPSREFYDGRLRPATPAVAGRSLPGMTGVDPEALPDYLDQVTLLDVGGDDAARTDAVEADRVARVVDDLTAAGVDPDDVGVIAPYRAQVAEIGRRVDVTVDTVDRFQGSSEEAIVVSFVATDDLSGPIFEDYRRVNVALTRAKRCLVLVGDAAALRTDPVYRRIVAWATVVDDP